MIKGIYNAAAGMLPQLNQQETVGNNLANVNTTGFKADRKYFRTALSSNMLQLGTYGEPRVVSEDDVSLVTDFSHGSMSGTRNPLDLAIISNGFFALETGESVSYTRNGNFTISPEGELINSRGYKVLGEGGPIRVVGNEIVIHSSGQIMIDGQSVGKIKIVDFEQPYHLKRNGYGYFVPDPPDEGITPDNIDVKQGFLESSNVDPISEMIQMIELNRNYESLQKSIQSQDDTLRMAISQAGG